MQKWSQLAHQEGALVAFGQISVRTGSARQTSLLLFQKGKCTFPERKRKMVYECINEPGVYFIGTPDEEDVWAYDMRPINFPELEKYAQERNIQGWITLELVTTDGVVYTPVVPSR